MTDLGIVMPVYKQKPAFLEAAMNSVLKQTFRDYKLVVVIDGAPEMEPLVRGLLGGDRRAEVISHAFNQGVAAALNTGFKALLGKPEIKYLTWVSTDNVYYPRFLDTLRSALAKGPRELGLVYSSFQSIDDEGRPLNSEQHLAVQRQYQSQPKEKLLDSSIVGVSFMYKACYAAMTDGYGMAPVEDYDYWLKLTEHCEIKFLPVELMDYRVDSAFSVSASLRTAEQHRKWRYAYHLTRHQARMRRGIAPAVTILYPLAESGPQAVERIENLYEQTFSNYLCYVLDLSPDMRVTADLSRISHPVTDFKWFPGANAATALLHAAQMLQTPYGYVLGPKLFKDAMDMNVLYDQLEKAPPSALSDYYTDDRTQLGYRHELASAGHAVYDELYRRQALVDSLKTIRAQSGDAT
ncbi:glycosyltransferase family 2 protein [Paenibacillus sp. MWE-103]|uniref:Glycosyltransferase family 2 protein n=1 Tax=Paenibacillus artemisiicola TaxID=1172618 RepID=A0ABS3W3E1_9BACL|nr:glycosyltransferase family A protein [Paenibacillus artemisiicola]MBO7742816.1 glycosyltransferase family 2 protein [Paenibacillus artemisiicola]